MRLKGKTALISGAGRNNGKSIALACAREGADVILVAKEREDTLNEVAKECETMGVQAMPLLADVGSPEEVNRVVKAGMQRFGKVDVLMSVAGLRPHKPFWEYGHDEWLQVFAVNSHALFYLAKALAPEMIKRGAGGSIVAIGSVSSLTPAKDKAVEVASKHALAGLVKSLALELGPYGIRANLIVLANIENKRLNPGWYKDTGGDPVTKASQARTPLGRQGTNQEVANVAVFLASDESSYVTGDRICCAGGIYM